MMFNVGDIVTGGKGSDRYSVTNEYGLYVVEEIDVSTIYIRVIGHRDNDELKGCHWVYAKYFVLTTVEKFMAENPSMGFVGNINDYMTNKEANAVELRMKKDVTCTLTAEERASLRQEIIDLLNEYDYHPTDYGVDTILDEWIKNKGWMIELFKKHPNYNGKFQIAFDVDYERKVNQNLIYGFTNYLYSCAEKMILVEKKIGCFTYSEVRSIRDRLCDVYSHMGSIVLHGYYPEANGKTMEDITKECESWTDLYNKFRYSRKFKIFDGKAYDPDVYKFYTGVCEFIKMVYFNENSKASEQFASKVNELFPNIKAVAGQKVSRIVHKVCKEVGIDKDSEYNREFAKYSDAINPLAIKRHTILSCHPVDYLTMSFGNSWSSCHTIDKGNKRGVGGDHYSGCYSAGTLSYALDGSSFVFYTVDKSYDGNEYELQNKINRNMFHIGEDKLIQGRIYPQATDGETGLYKQIREIVQKVIADCLGIPNMWKNVKGTTECSYRTSSYGYHYRDYTRYSDCNVSYLKGDTEYINRNRIDIGHDAICPHCGKEHEESQTIECYNCYHEK